MVFSMKEKIEWNKYNFLDWVNDFENIVKSYIEDYSFRLTESIKWSLWLLTYQFLLWEDIIINCEYKKDTNFLNIISIETSNSEEKYWRITSNRIKIKNSWRYVINKILEIAKKDNYKTIIFSNIHLPNKWFYEKIIDELINEKIIYSFNFKNIDQNLYLRLDI